MKSNKQIKANISRTNFENKSKSQSNKIVSDYYEMIGKKVPKKIQENRATQKDFLKYQQTIINTLDRRILKDSNNPKSKPSTNSKSLLSTLNSINSMRANTITKNLHGYDENFINGIISGKVGIIGKNIQFSTKSTVPLNMENIEKRANRNNTTTKKYLESEIKAMQDNLKDLKQITSDQYYLKQINELLEGNGLTLTEQNQQKVARKLKTVDWLGKYKLMEIMNTKLTRMYYEIYKKLLQLDNQFQLLESIFNDIDKSSHNKMVEKARIFEG